MTRPYVLDVFLDTSGKESNEEDTVLTVAACMATPYQWNRFRVEWFNILKNTPLPLTEHGSYVFHTTDFWSKKKKPYRDEDGWNDPVRKATYRSLIEAIVKFTAHRTAIAISLTDYRMLCSSLPITKSAIGKAGSFAMSQIFKNCAVWASDNRFPLSFNYISDHKDEFWGEVSSIVDKLALDPSVRANWGFKQGGFTSASTAKYPEIQAADVIAWELSKEIKQAADRDPTLEYRSKPALNALNANGSNFRFYALDAIESSVIDEVVATVQVEVFNEEDRKLFETDPRFASEIESMIYSEMKKAN